MSISPVQLTRDTDLATGARRITVNVDMVTLLDLPLLSLMAALIRRARTSA